MDAQGKGCILSQPIFAYSLQPNAAECSTARRWVIFNPVAKRWHDHSTSMAGPILLFDKVA